jgi:hypothetical protein
MAGNKPDLQHESDVSIDSFVLISGTGNKIDLRYQLLELNVFEDIFSPTLTATVLIVDSLNLVEKLALCGQEWVFIRISKPGLRNDKDEELSFAIMMRVYKIEAVKHEIFKFTYVLHLCKEEVILSQKTTVCKSFDTIKPEIAIKDVFLGFLDYEDEDMFANAFDNGWPIKTKTIALSFTVPCLPPLEAVTYIASLARGPNGINDYLFFENTGGYRFQSLSDMMASQPLMKIKYKIKNSGQGDGSADPYFDTFAYTSFSGDTLFDYMKSLEQGEFGVQSDVFDLSSQKFISNPISYNKFRKNYKGKDFTLNPYSKIPKNDWQEEFEDGKKIDGGYSVFKVVPQSSGTGTTNDYASEDRATRMMQVASLVNQRFRVQMPGSSFLKSGDTILLDMPSIQSRGSLDSKDDLLDKYLAAKYLITSVRHVITTSGTNKWNTYLEITKDSLPAELPEMYAQAYSLTVSGDNSNA